jgi:hypothetical protein
VNGFAPTARTGPPDAPARLPTPPQPAPGGPPAPIQRRVEIGDVTTEPEAATPPAAAGNDPEELFRVLYPRVRDELRWELLVQRERAGLLGDPL